MSSKNQCVGRVTFFGADQRKQGKWSQSIVKHSSVPLVACCLICTLFLDIVKNHYLFPNTVLMLVCVDQWLFLSHLRHWKKKNINKNKYKTKKELSQIKLNPLKHKNKNRRKKNMIGWLQNDLPIVMIVQEKNITKIQLTRQCQTIK